MVSATLTLTQLTLANVELKRRVGHLDFQLLLRPSFLRISSTIFLDIISTYIKVREKNIRMTSTSTFFLYFPQHILKKRKYLYKWLDCFFFTTICYIKAILNVTILLILFWTRFLKDNLLWKLSLTNHGEQSYLNQNYNFC